MTIDSLNKRLSRLSDTASPKASIAHSLEMAVERQKARQAEWIAAGNTGPVPPEPWLLEPPPPETARRYDRELWRKIAKMHARRIFMRSGESDELRAAYAMSDADLYRVISQREQALWRTVSQREQATIADGDDHAIPND